MEGGGGLEILKRSIFKMEKLTLGLLKIEHNYTYIYSNATATELLLNYIVVTPVL